jgi:PAS domain S-box-containing protein
LAVAQGSLLADVYSAIASERLGQALDALDEGDVVQKLAERSIQTGLLGHAAESAAASFLVLDESGRLVAANRSACAMLGYERDELLGLSIGDVEVSPLLERLLAAGEAGIAWLRRADGGMVLVRYEARAATAGSVRLRVLVAHPFTTRVVASRAVERTVGTRPPGSRHDLTRRELEVLVLLAEGLENDEISKHLFISRETVKSHVRRLLQKLDARSRAHAVALGMRESLID